MIKPLTNIYAPCQDGFVRFWVTRPTDCFTYDTDLPEVVKCAKELGAIFFTVTAAGSIAMRIYLESGFGEYMYQERPSGWEITGNAFMSERLLRIMQSAYRRLKPFLLGQI